MQQRWFFGVTVIPPRFPPMLMAFRPIFGAQWGVLTPFRQNYPVRRDRIASKHAASCVYWQRTENVKARPVLRQALVADMGETKYPLDDQHLQIIVSSGAASLPRSMLTTFRIAALS